MRHQMTGMGLDDQPHFLPGVKLQSVPRRESQVYLNFHAAKYSSHDHHVALLQREYPACKNILGTQTFGADSRQQDVSSANSDAHIRT